MKDHSAELKEYQALIEKLGYASYNDDDIPENVVCYDPHQQNSK